MLGARNRKWLPKIEALLEEDRDYLVVVGALHFVGRDGLLALLTEGRPQSRGGTGRQDEELSDRPMRAFAIFLGLIALGLAGIAILGYPAWLLISPWLDNPKFHRIASRIGMLRCWSWVSSSSRAISRSPIGASLGYGLPAGKFVAEVGKAVLLRRAADDAGAASP